MHASALVLLVFDIRGMPIDTTIPTATIVVIAAFILGIALPCESAMSCKGPLTSPIANAYELARI